jgi:hypothetical protein
VKIAVLAVILFSSVATAAAQDLSVDAASLKGINGIQVVVEEPDDSGKALGLSRDAIQGDVELKLRSAGVRVVSGRDNFGSPGSPFLHVDVMAIDRTTVASIELCQNVHLMRNREFSVGTTWSRRMMETNATAETTRNLIKDEVDFFLKDLLSVNSRKPTTRTRPLGSSLVPDQARLNKNDSFLNDRLSMNPKKL